MVSPRYDFSRCRGTRDTIKVFWTRSKRQRQECSDIPLRSNANKNNSLLQYSNYCHQGVDHVTAKRTRT